jgi:outer membrane protein assembly factor BamB
MTRRTLLAISLLLLLIAPAPGQSVAPWATYRGNPQRTGNTDGKPGPTGPKVLWAYKSKDHHLSSPVPLADDRLMLAGLTGFNSGFVSCLNTDPTAKQRIAWSKSAPLLKLPTVSSPAVMGGTLVFGDGMHQTNGATLYCLDGADGTPLWQLDEPGKLVHLESSPTVVDGRAYTGGGNAGVVCAEADRAKLAGKTLELPALKKAVAAGWEEVKAKYEIERKKNADLPPPDESQYPRAEPQLLWQQGKDKWHVDAPVAVAGDKVLAASVFLTDEKLGDRALICLDAKMGGELWKTPLKMNPWGGPSVDGDTVVVSGGTIGFYPNQLKGAKGFVAAFDLAGGKVKWSKDVTGSVTSCAAVADGAAVVTATDGKVRAFELADGGRRWVYEAGAPLFAPPAVAGDTVYAGDLRGVVHAIDLKTGKGRWRLDLATDPATQSPGMIYGGPVVHGGRLFVATCNLEGEHARKETVVVCVGEK